MLGEPVLWSPDGRWIATYGPEHAITLLAADGSGQRLLPVASRTFDWSPDGSTLVYGEAGHADSLLPSGWDPASIFVIGADGKGQRWLADGEHPDWSR